MDVEDKYFGVYDSNKEMFVYGIAELTRDKARAAIVRTLGWVYPQYRYRISELPLDHKFIQRIRVVDTNGAGSSQI